MSFTWKPGEGERNTLQSHSPKGAVNTPLQKYRHFS